MPTALPAPPVEAVTSFGSGPLMACLLHRWGREDIALRAVPTREHVPDRQAEVFPGAERQDKLVKDAHSAVSVRK